MFLAYRLWTFTVFEIIQIKFKFLPSIGKKKEVIAILGLHFLVAHGLEMLVRLL